MFRVCFFTRTSRGAVALAARGNRVCRKHSKVVGARGRVYLYSRYPRCSKNIRLHPLSKAEYSAVEGTAQTYTVSEYIATSFAKCSIWTLSQTEVVSTKIPDILEPHFARRSLTQVFIDLSTSVLSQTFIGCLGHSDGRGARGSDGRSIALGLQIRFSTKIFGLSSDVSNGR